LNIASVVCPRINTILEIENYDDDEDDDYEEEVMD
jgi:hypothetical protein